VDDASIVSALAALGQSTRLAVYKLLLENEPAGLPAGDIAKQIGTPQNTMSNHLAVLSGAGLVRSARHSQRIIYRADPKRFGEVLAALTVATGSMPIVL
jgi:ArsR family transcriptional regulator, arsenate/arsenite/antimonite-responsive transcriptional repressor